VDAGVLVDHADNDLMAAFRVMMQLHNNKPQSRFRVEDETLMLPMENSFSVGTASKYRVDHIIGRIVEQSYDDFRNFVRSSLHRS